MSPAAIRRPSSSLEPVHFLMDFNYDYRNGVALYRPGISLLYCAAQPLPPSFLWYYKGSPQRRAWLLFWLHQSNV